MPAFAGPPAASPARPRSKTESHRISSPWAPSVSHPVIIRTLPEADYLACWHAMERFTTERSAATADEIWLVQHPPVFTLGRAGRDEHILAAGDIPVIRCDRGGQATYHGPGQVIAYLLLDLRRLPCTIRALVAAIQHAAVGLLADWRVAAHGDPHAPGVYVGAAKIASLGLGVRRRCTYHGLALNHAMDMEPWTRINPCGYAGLPMTDLAHVGVRASRAEVERRLVAALCAELGLRAQFRAAPAWYHAPQPRAA